MCSSDLAMGVVLGITAHGRTQEKINGVDTPSLPSLSNLVPQQVAHAPQPLAAHAAPTPAPSFPPPVHGFVPPQAVSSNKFGNVVPQPEDPIL